MNQELQNKNLNIRISGRLLEDIRRAAQKAQSESSSWVRKALEQAVHKELAK